MINYDISCKKLFTKYFKLPYYSFDEIISLAGKLYHDKNVLDYIVNYSKDDRFDTISVWKITEMILEKYSSIDVLQNQTCETLSKRIGDAITHSNN